MLILIIMVISAVSTGVGILVTNVTTSGVAGLIAGVITWIACVSQVSK